MSKEYYTYGSDKFLNRSALYGENIFTSLQVVSGVPLFFCQHIERLLLSVKFYTHSNKYLISIAEEKIYRSMKEVLKLIDLNLSYYFRINILFYSDELSLSSEINDLEIIINYQQLPEVERTLKLKTSLVKKESSVFPSFFKLGNYSQEMWELSKVKREGFTDLLYSNKEGFISECSTSNIFFIKNEKIMTPSLDCQCLDGVTRKQLIRELNRKGHIVEEGHFDIGTLIEADFAFATNSVKGLSLISSIDGKSFNLEKVNCFTKIQEVFAESCKKYVEEKKSEKL